MWLTRIIKSAFSWLVYCRTDHDSSWCIVANSILLSRGCVLHRYPVPWLPAAKQEWWQLKLDEIDAKVGLVQIGMPHDKQVSRSRQSNKQILHYYYRLEMNTNSGNFRTGWLVRQTRV